MKATWITAGMMALGSMALPATSEAGVHVRVGLVFTGHQDYGFDHRNDRRDLWRSGYELGYRDGAIEGSRDGRHGGRYDYRPDGNYRHGSRGYGWDDGRGWRYAQGYRRGFEDGYRRGYSSRAAYRYDGDDYRRDYGRYDDRETYRHRHPGRSGWCYDRHPDWNDQDWGRVIYEQPSGRW